LLFVGYISKLFEGNFNRLSRSTTTEQALIGIIKNRFRKCIGDFWLKSLGDIILIIVKGLRENGFEVADPEF